MNTDFRLSIGLFTHPKFLKLKRRLGEAGALSYIVLLSFTAQHKPTGDLGRMDADDIAIAAQWSGDPEAFLSCLVTLGLLDETEDGYEVHDWAEHNPWAVGAPKRSKKAKDAANARWSGDNCNSSAENAPSMPQALPQASFSNAPLLSSPLPTKPIPTKDVIPTVEQRGGTGEEIPTNGAPDKPVTPSVKAKKPEVSEDEWMDSLKANPAYAHIDIDRERQKCLVWCDTNHERPSRRRFVNWLNRIDPPLKPAPSDALTVRGSPAANPGTAPPGRQSPADRIADTNRRTVAAAIAASQRSQQNHHAPTNEENYHDDFARRSHSLP